jgi:hypothetical protein
MHLQDFGDKGPKGPTGDGVHLNGRPRASCRPLMQMHHAGAAPVRRPAANLLQHGCASLAERIRASTGVSAGDTTSEKGTAADTPWLGLLLWFFACAALFVSLIMRPDDLDRDRRVAARGDTVAPISDHLSGMRGLTGPASDVSLITPRRLPPRSTAD